MIRILLFVTLHMTCFEYNLTKLYAKGNVLLLIVTSLWCMVLYIASELYKAAVIVAGVVTNNADNTTFFSEMPINT